MFGVYGAKISSTNQPNFCFVTAEQYNLGTAKPKNVFK